MIDGCLIIRIFLLHRVIDSLAAAVRHHLLHTIRRPQGRQLVFSPWWRRGDPSRPLVVVACKPLC